MCDQKSIFESIGLGGVIGGKREAERQEVRAQEQATAQLEAGRREALAALEPTDLGQDLALRQQLGRGTELLTRRAAAQGLTGTGLVGEQRRFIGTALAQRQALEQQRRQNLAAQRASIISGFAAPLAQQEIAERAPQIAGLSELSGLGFQLAGSAMGGGQGLGGLFGGQTMAPINQGLSGVQPTSGGFQNLQSTLFA